MIVKRNKNKKALDKNSYAYKKYVEPTLKREKAYKVAQRKKWWAENWLAMSGNVIAFISLIVSIIALSN